MLAWALTRDGTPRRGPEQKGVPWLKEEVELTLTLLFCLLRPLRHWYHPLNVVGRLPFVGQAGPVSLGAG